MSKNDAVRSLEATPQAGGKEVEAAAVEIRRHDAWGVVVQLHDACWLKAKVTRAFPLTAPETEVALLSAKGEEIGTLSDWEALDPESRLTVETEFARRYLVSTIEEVKEIRAEGETLYWTVVTTRGPREFVVKANRDTVLSPAPGRLLLVDVDGSRFEIPALGALDSASKKILDTVF